ncbi:MAG: hypothetical protein FWC47_13995 [Oscillospiraceae bacterium]|nr:hypothetical protein [Oscillospiraceae bacterium]
MNFNLLPFMAYCFSINESIYGDIDNLYNKNEPRFYKSAKMSAEYNASIIMQGSIKQEEYYKKSIGIFENAKDFESEINSIISKGWAFTYKYCQMNSNLDALSFISDFGDSALASENEELNNSNYIIFLFVGRGRIQNREVLEDMIIDKFDLNNDKATNIDSHKKKIADSIYKMAKDKYGNLEDFKKDIYEKIRFTDTVKSSQFFVDLLFDRQKLSFGQIWDQFPLDDDEIESIFYDYIIADLNFEDKEQEISAIASNCLFGMYLCKFIKAYNEIKRYHFSKIDELKGQIQNSKLVIPDYKTDMEITLTRLQDRGTKELLDKIYKLEQENERLRNILELIKLNNQ